MGNWHISIQGTGAHHNDIPEDANVMFHEFVNNLRLAGQDVEEASFTYGSTEKNEPLSKSFHIVYDGSQNGWAIKVEGCDYVAYRDTQEQALDYAVAATGGRGRIIVHKKDGTFSDMSQ